MRSFFRRLDEYLDYAERRSMTRRTFFLEPYLQEAAEAYLAGKGVFYGFFGGAVGAERKRLVISPDSLPQSCDSGISILRAEVPGSEDFSHRDILGGIMASGLDRKTIGDIFPGREIYVCADEKAASWLLSAPLSVRGGSLGFTLCESDGEIEIEVMPGEKKIISVPSLRIDAVLASGFGFSRSKAADFFRKGLVKLNGMEDPRTTLNCCPGDIISLRGQGRLKINGFAGESRKGRFLLETEKYH